MSDTSTITVSPGSGQLLRGDVITFAGRAPWWKRWLRRILRRPPPGHKVFMITGCTATTVSLAYPTPELIAWMTGRTIPDGAQTRQEIVRDLIEIDGFATERVFTYVDDWREFGDGFRANMGWVHMGHAAPAGTYLLSQ